MYKSDSMSHNEPMHVLIVDMYGLIMTPLTRVPRQVAVGNMNVTVILDVISKSNI